MGVSGTRPGPVVGAMVGKEMGNFGIKKQTQQMKYLLLYLYNIYSDFS